MNVVGRFEAARSGIVRGQDGLESRANGAVNLRGFPLDDHTEAGKLDQAYELVAGPRQPERAAAALRAKLHPSDLIDDRQVRLLDSSAVQADRLGRHRNLDGITLGNSSVGNR